MQVNAKKIVLCVIPSLTGNLGTYNTLDSLFQGNDKRKDSKDESFIPLIPKNEKTHTKLYSMNRSMK